MWARRLRATLAALGALAAASLWWPADHAAAAPVDACALVPSEAAMWAVAAASPGDMATATLAPGSCRWRGTSPSCFLRALSVTVTFDDLPPASSVLIEHLHVRRADTLLEPTVLGRLAPESSHQILGDLARTVDARVSGGSL